jgi:hypothetical protein
MKQHHFVVCFDEETNSFDVDYQTQDAVFNGQPIFDPASENWEPLGSYLDDDDSIYNRAADALFEAVTDLALREKGENK